MAKKKSSLTAALQNAQRQENQNIKLNKTKTKTKTIEKNKKNKSKFTNDKIKSLTNPNTQKSTPSLSMVDKNDKVLLIGEGNFSFTVTLLVNHSHPGELITASTIDSKQTVLEKYPESSELLNFLEENQVTILFELDGCKLNEDKRIKNKIKLEGKFNKVIFNFPHVGGSEPDQDRSVRANQILILRFLRSVSGLLFQPDNHNHQASMITTRKSHTSSKSGGGKHPKKHPRNSLNSDHDHLLDLDDSDSELHPSHSRECQKAGTVLITTGTSSPYSLWNVPKLAKNGNLLAHTILYPTHPSLKLKGDQPNYKTIRSFDFDQFISNNNNNNTGNNEPISSSFDSTPMTYQHRQTNGLKNTLNKDSKPSSPRTWEFELVS